MTQIQDSSDERGPVSAEDISDEDEDEITHKLPSPEAIAAADVLHEATDDAASLPTIEPTEVTPLMPIDTASDDHTDDSPNDPLFDKTVDLDMPSLVALQAADPDTDESATLEGAPLLEDQATLKPPTPPTEGDIVMTDVQEKLSLEQALGEQRGCVFFRARVEGDESAYTAVWSANTPPEPPWTRIPDPRVVRPRARVSMDRAAVRVFGRPRGNTVIEYLGDGERYLPAMATLELGIELAEILEGLHGAGQYLLDLDPSQIVIERGGKVRLYAINGFLPAGQMPAGELGPYAPPEVQRRMRYLVGAHSDVFAVAYLIYCLLARRPPLDAELDPHLLQNPRIFRPECPLGIWPYLDPCLAASPTQRIGHARGLKEQLMRARARLLEEAQAAGPEPIVLEAWAEVHHGLGKARRGADQQDRALALTDDAGQIGFYVIADGVSRSKFGDGAFAAEQVNVAAAQRWQALERAGGLDLNHAQRSDCLRQVARSAGKKISAEVNARHAPVPNEPNQVMSSTLVSAFINDGEATIANLGDSRAYLVRDETIERVSIDHDRATDALRMGLSFREASEVRMGAALTRVVGRVIIDEDGTSRPDPFDPEVFRMRLLPGDRLLICSDGVADFAAGAGSPTREAERAMLNCLLEYEDPARAAFELVVLANRAGGYDNISCVVIAAHPG